MIAEATPEPEPEPLVCPECGADLLWHGYGTRAYCCRDLSHKPVRVQTPTSWNKYTLSPGVLAYTPSRDNRSLVMEHPAWPAWWRKHPEYAVGTAPRYFNIDKRPVAKSHRKWVGWLRRNKKHLRIAKSTNGDDLPVTRAAWTGPFDCTVTPATNSNDPAWRIYWANVTTWIRYNLPIPTFEDWQAGCQTAAIPLPQPQEVRR